MIRRIVFGAVGVILLVYLGLVAYLYFNQRNYFYAPLGRMWELTEAQLEAEAVSIPTADEATVHGWYAAPSSGMPVILYFKGNSGSFTAEYERYQAFALAGYGFLAFDYRGFPASPGTITEANILADALAAYDWLAERGDPILIWGRSLGSAPAVHTASRRDSLGVLLESPFYSAVTVAGERYPYAPVNWLMLDQFRSNEWIAEVASPVFIVHGTDDVVISAANGERLFAEVGNPYALWLEPGGGHGDLWERGLWERAQAFFADVTAPAAD